MKVRWIVLRRKLTFRRTKKRASTEMNFIFSIGAILPSDWHSEMTSSHRLKFSFLHRKSFETKRRSFLVTSTERAEISRWTVFLRKKYRNYQVLFDLSSTENPEIRKISRTKTCFEIFFLSFFLSLSFRLDERERSRQKLFW